MVNCEASLSLRIPKSRDQPTLCLPHAAIRSARLRRLRVTRFRLFPYKADLT